MKKVIGTVSSGFSTERTAEFEFEDNVTENEIYDEVYAWALQFIDIDWEEVSDE